MKFINKKQVTNGEIIFGIILSCIAGFVWAYLHYGVGIPW